LTSAWSQRRQPSVGTACVGKTRRRASPRLARQLASA